jgi:hypothetical protein
MTLMAGGRGSGDAEGRCRYGGGDNYIKDRMGTSAVTQRVRWDGATTTQSVGEDSREASRLSQDGSGRPRVSITVKKTSIQQTQQNE